MKSLEKHLNCRGLVLRSQVYGDKDLIFTLLTQEYGKVGVISRSARAGKKNSSGIPELMDLGEFELHQGRGNLYTVKHFKPLAAFKSIRSNLNSFVCACCWIDSLEHLTGDAHQDSHELFETAFETLRSLDRATDARSACRELCLGLESALEKTGFGSEHSDLPVGFKKLHSLARRIEEVSSRELKSWESVLDIVKRLMPQQ